MLQPKKRLTKINDSIPIKNTQIKRLTNKQLFNTKPLDRPSSIDSVAVKSYDGSIPNAKQTTDIYKGVLKKFGKKSVEGIKKSKRTSGQILKNPDFMKTKATFKGRADYYNKQK